MSENESTISASITATEAGKDKNRSGGMDNFSIRRDLEQITEKLTGLFVLISALFTTMCEVGTPTDLSSADIFVNIAADELILEIKEIEERIRSAS